MSAALLAPVLAIAGQTLREARRNRLPWLLLLLTLAAVGLSGFLQALALTESRQLQGAVLAAVLRLAAAFLLATFVITSMAREANDKALELLLAMAMPRAAYLFGKLAGFAALALLPALLFGALALCFAPPAQAALWAFTLLCELWLVAAFSVLCMLTLEQVLPALSAAAGFYLLARLIVPLQQLGQGGAGEAGQQWLQGALKLIGLLLPHLDGYARSDWLLYGGGGAADLLAVLAQTGCGLALLVGAALFDLYRKSI